MPITDNLGRVYNESFTFEQMKGLLESKVTPVLDNIKMTIKQKAESFDKQTAKNTSEIVKSLDDIKKFNKDKVQKLVDKYLNNNSSKEIEEINKTLIKVEKLLTNLNSNIKTSKENSFDLSKVSKIFENATNIIEKSLKATGVAPTGPKANNFVNGFRDLSGILGKIHNELKNALPSMKEMAMAATRRGSIYTHDIHIHDRFKELEGILKFIEGPGIRGNEGAGPFTARQEVFKDVLRQLAEKGTFILNEAQRAIWDSIQSVERARELQTARTAAGNRGSLSPGGVRAAAIKEELESLAREMAESNTKGKPEFDRLFTEIIKKIEEPGIRDVKVIGCIDICDKSIEMLANAIHSHANAIDFNSLAQGLSNLADRTGGHPEETLKELTGLLQASKTDIFPKEAVDLLMNISGNANNIYSILQRWMQKDCINICEQQGKNAIEENTNALNKLEQSSTKANKKTVEVALKTPLMIDFEKKHGKEAAKAATELIGPIVESMVKEEVKAVKGVFQEQISPDFSYEITVLNKLENKIQEIMTSILEQNPLYALFSNKDLLRGESRFRRELYETLFVQQQMTWVNRDLQKQFEMTGNSVSESVSSWERIAKVTGQEITGNLSNYVKLLRSGIKEQRTAERLMKTAGSLATAIGVKSESTGEMLTTWNLQLQLSTEQSAQMARNISEVGRVTGLVGENLLKSVRATESLLKSLRNAATLTAEIARNFMVARAEAEKTGVGEEVDSILKALVSGTDFINNADDGIRNILALATGRTFGPGLFNEILLGRGGKRDSLKKIGQSFDQLVKDLVRDVGGIEIGSLKELKDLPEEVRLVVDNALYSMSKGKVRIGNIEMQAQALIKAGQSFADQMKELDAKLLSKVATNQEKALVNQQRQNLLLNENFRIQTAISENLEARPDLNLSAGIESAIDKLAKQTPEFNKELKSMNINAFSSIEIARQSLEQVYDSLFTELEKVGKQRELKVKKEDITAALADKTGKRYRQVLADLNESQQILTTAQKTATDPMAALTQTINELNSMLRGFTGGVFVQFIDAVGQAGLILLTAVTGLGLAVLQIKVIERTFGGFIGHLLSAEKEVQGLSLLSGPLSRSFGNLAYAVTQSSQVMFGFVGAINSGTVAVTTNNKALLAAARSAGLTGSIAQSTQRLTGGIEAIPIGRTRAARTTLTAGQRFAGTASGIAGSYTQSRFLANIGDTIIGLMGGLFNKIPNILNLKEFGAGFEATKDIFSKSTLSIAQGALKPLSQSLMYVTNLIGKWIGPLAVVVGLFEGIANKNEELGTTLSILSGLFTGSTKIGSSGLDRSATVDQRKAAEAQGIAFGALQGATVGGFLGAFFGPVGAVVGSILGAITGMIVEAIKITTLGGALSHAINQTWEKLKESWQILVDGFNSLVNNISKPFMKIWTELNSIFDTGKIDFDAIIAGFGSVVKILAQVLSVALSIVGSGVGDALLVAWRLFKPVVEGIKLIFGGIWKAVAGLAEGDWKSVFAGIGEALFGVWKSVVAGVRAIAAAVPMIFMEFLGGALRSIGDLFGKDSAIGQIFIKLGNILSNINSIIQSIFDVAIGLLTFDFKLVTKGFFDLFSSIGSLLSNIGGLFYNFLIVIKDTILAIPNIILTVFRSIDWIKIGQYISTGLLDMFNNIGNVIKNIDWSGIGNYIKDNFANGLAIVGAAIVTWFIGLPAIIGAATVGLGLYIITAIGQGISEAIGGLLEGIANAIKESTFSKVLIWIADIFYTIADILGSTIKVFEGFIQILTGDFTNGLNKVGKYLMDIPIRIFDWIGKQLRNVFGNTAIDWMFGKDFGRIAERERIEKAANKATMSLVGAMEEGANSISKSISQLKADLFSQADNTLKIQKVLQKEVTGTTSLREKSLQGLKNLGITQIESIIQKTKTMPGGLDDKENQKKLFAEIANSISVRGETGLLRKRRGGTGSIEVSEGQFPVVQSLLKDFIAASIEENKITTAAQEKLKEIPDHVRKLQEATIAFTQNKPNADKMLASAIWNYPNLSGLSGSQAIDQTLKTMLESVDDETVKGLITDRKTIGVLSSSLTFEQKQTALLEEMTKLQKDLLNNTDPQTQINNMQKAASVQAAMKQQQQVKAITSQLQSAAGFVTSEQLANTSTYNLPQFLKDEINKFSVGQQRLTMNWDNLDKKSIDLLQQVAQGKGGIETSPLSKADKQKIIDSANRILGALQSEFVQQQTGLTKQIETTLVGTAQDKASQMVEIWRQALSLPQMLINENALITKQAKSRLEKTIAADSAYKALMVDLENRINQSAQYEKIIKDKIIESGFEKRGIGTDDYIKALNKGKKGLAAAILKDRESFRSVVEKELEAKIQSEINKFKQETNKLAIEAAGLRATMQQQTTPQQEAAAAIETLANITKRQVTAEQKGKYEKDLTGILQSAFYGKNATEGLKGVLDSLGQRQDTILYSNISPLIQELAKFPDINKEIANREGKLLNRFSDIYKGASVGSPAASKEAKDIITEIYKLRLAKSTFGSIQNPADILPGGFFGGRQDLQNLLKGIGLDLSGLNVPLQQIFPQITRMVSSFRDEDPVLRRARELATKAGIPWSDQVYTTLGRGGAQQIPTQIGRTPIPTQFYTPQEVIKIIDDIMNRNDENQKANLQLFRQQHEENKRRGLVLDNSATGIFTAGLDATNMPVDLNRFVERALERGSIYTHDIHAEEKLSNILTKLESIEVSVLAPNTRVNEDDEVRKQRVQEAVNKTMLATQNLESIASSTEENTEKTNKLLEKVAEALVAIKELLTPKQSQNKSGKSTSNRNTNEEPFWEPMVDTTYIYPTGEGAGWDIYSD